MATAAAAGAAIALAAALEQLDIAVAHARPVRSTQSSAVARVPSVVAPSGPLRHVVVGVIALCVGMVVASPSLAAIVGASAAGISVLRAGRAARSRARACELATPALARVVADALRGGSSIRSALLDAADDRSIPGALRQAVAVEARALEVGAALPPVLESLAAAGGPSLRLFCGTVALQLESGGRLSSELERLAAAVDDARRVDQDRVAATAQARATVRVVGALPLLALGAAQLANPSFFSQVASNPIALGLLLLGLLLEVVAFVAARALVGPAR